MWEFLGGLQTLVQRTVGIMLPQLFLIFVLAGAVAGLTIEATSQAMFATPQGADALLALAAGALFTILAVVVSAVFAWRWGNFHLTYTASAALMAPLSLYLFITGSVVVAQSESASEYVVANWSDLLNFVGPLYSDKGPRKYGEAAALGMEQAGTMALVLAMTMLVYLLMSLRAACWSVRVGPKHVQDAWAPPSEAEQSLVGNNENGGVAGSHGKTRGGYGALSENTGASAPGAARSTLDAATLGRSPAQPAAPPADDAFGDSDDEAESGAVEIDTRSVTSERSRMDDTFDTVETPHVPSRTGAAAPPPGAMLTESALSGSGMSSNFRYARHSYVVAITEPVSVATWLEATKEEVQQTLKQELKCIVCVGVVVVLALLGVAGGLVGLSDSVRCGGLARNAKASHFRTYEREILYSNSVPNPGYVISLQHAFPLGSVRVQTDETPVSGLEIKARVVMRQWALDESALISEQVFNDAITEHKVPFQATDDFADDDSIKDSLTGSDMFFTSATTGVTDAVAQQQCSSLEVVIYLPIVALYTSALNFTVDHAFTNVSGVFDQTKFTLRSANLRSLDGPQLVTSALMFTTPSSVLPGGLRMESLSGDLSTDLVVADEVSMLSGGDITSSLLVAGTTLIFPPYLEVRGGIEMTCNGSGRVGLTKVFSATSVALTSFSGDIIIDGGIGYVAGDMDLKSTWGDIYMTSMILAAANHTTVHSMGGSISGTAVFSNDLDVTSKYGSVSMIQAFIGIDTPPDTNNDGVFPPAIVEYPYVKPRLHLASEYGAVVMIGLNAGTSNKSTKFNEMMSVEMTTVGGDIRVQVGGGAYVGPFSLETEDGARVVELNGTAGGNSGVIGNVPVNSTSYFNVRTKTGDIDFSAAANPLGALASFFT